MQGNERKYLENLNENKKKKGKKCIWIGLCSILMAIGMLGVFMLPGEATTEKTVDERLTISFHEKSNYGKTAQSGNALYAVVVSNYSGANQDTAATITIDLGQLPEEITVAGFEADGTKKVSKKDASTQADTGELITLTLSTDNEGYSYVTYTQPQGSTLEFDLQFNSKNGITNDGTKISLSVTKDDISGITYDESKDTLPGDFTLTWTAGNAWDPVVKKVNDTDDTNKIGVRTDDKLSGTLTYTITANSSNNESSGELWTDHIVVEDTLTLPKGITLPEGATLNEGKDAIVDSEGTAIISFTELQGGTVNSLSYETDENSVTTISYQLIIPNAYKTEDGVPTKEQDNLSLEMILQAEALVLEQGYYNTLETNKTADPITNHVKITPIPYTCETGTSTEDSVTTTPYRIAENYTFSKTTQSGIVDSGVAAGEEFQYVIYVNNEKGSTPIRRKNADGDYYIVKDTLPPGIYMTDTQMEAVKQMSGASCVYDAEKDTYTITWIPSSKNSTDDWIGIGEICSLRFSVTVKDAATMRQPQINNGGTITNSATYKGKTVYAHVKYKTPIITLTKSADKTTVYNGDTITYNVLVGNNTRLDFTESEIITDTLPAGLTLQSVSIGKKTILAEGSNSTTGTFAAHDSSENCGKEHNVTFTQEGQKLTWDVGCMAAGEYLILTYTCSVDTDQISADTNKNKGFINTVESITGKSSTCIVGIANPIQISKTVEESTELPYPNKQVFHYTITVRNEKDHPSTRKDLVLVDELDEGLLPIENYVLYTDENATIEANMSWSEYAEADIDSLSAAYYTKIDGNIVKVTRNDAKIVLSWEVGSIAPGAAYTVSYQAQIHLTDEEMASGDPKAFTNVASIDGMSSTVTVHGGVVFGSLELTKVFATINGDTSGTDYSYVYKQIVEGDPEYDVAFVLEGKTSTGDKVVFENGDADDTTRMTISLADMVQYEASPYGFFFEVDGLPAGTYTITEKNYAQDGKDIEPQFSVDGVLQESGDSVEFIIKDKTAVGVNATNVYHEPAKVNVQKSVFEIAQVDEDGTWTSLPEKYLFSTDTEETTYVVYNVTVSAFGEGSVQICSLYDYLPDGLKFVGVYNLASYTGKADFVSGKTLFASSVLNKLENSMVTNASLETGVSFRSINLSTSYYEPMNRVRFYLNADDDTIKDEDGNEVHILHSGEAFTFLMLCEVTDNVPAGQKLTNTIELGVKDTAELDSTNEYQMENTPYDSNQNNGDARVTATEDGKKLIESTVTIEAKNIIVPGIEKNAVAYHEAEKTEEKALSNDTNIPTASAVKWQVTLYNNGTIPMENYQVDDVVTQPFHLMTKAEAEKHGLSQPFTYAIYDHNGKELKTFDLSTAVWADINGTTVSEYSFSFRGSDYTIPAGGYAVLTEYTYNTTDSKMIYQNTATLIPTQEFDANKVQIGELVKDSEGKYTGVSASDVVYALGEFASVSWKTITEKGDSTNTAQGNKSKNYITVGYGVEDVTYTNNIKNVSGNTFQNFVVIDLLPMVGDTGVVNQSDKRGSEFSVLFAENLKLQVLDSKGSVVNDQSKYTIQFSTKKSFTEEDFGGSADEQWHNSWKAGDCSFRIIMASDFVLSSQQTLVISYDGKISEDAVPGTIAWNSFGYQYYSSGHSTAMRAEPPKVGVKRPIVPVIQKIVKDDEGNELAANENVAFTFALWKSDTKLCEFTVTQGGTTELKDLVDAAGNKVKLVDGTTYTITEVTDSMPVGYELVGIGESDDHLSDSYTFTYSYTNDIQVVAVNKIGEFGMELPETGKISAFVCRVTGAFILLFGILLSGYRSVVKRKNKVK